MTLADLRSLCLTWSGGFDCHQGQTKFTCSAQGSFSLLFAPLQPTSLPCCFKKCREVLWQSEWTLAHQNKAKWSCSFTWTAQKRVPSLGPWDTAPPIPGRRTQGGLCWPAPRARQKETWAVAHRSPPQPTLNLPFSVYEVTHGICALYSPGLLWGSNEIMYVKRFVNCKMLYKCKGLL